MTISLASALGLTWGAIVASPLILRARRAAVAGRVLAPGARGEVAGTAAFPSRLRVALTRLEIASGPVGRVVRGLAWHRAHRVRDAALARELPVALDLLGVAVGAGCTPYLAVETVAQWAPPLSARVFRGVLRSCSLGTSFDAALDDAVEEVPTLRPLADALLASERLGAPIGPALARLAVEERTGLRRRAEAHARRVPVRLLFPLVFLVLPAFVVLTVVPGLASGLAGI